MAAYSPPTTPQPGEDICEDLLRHLDEQIQATQQQHNEAKKKLQKERRCATIHQPMGLNQLENTVNEVPGFVHTVQQDYSFNLTGITPPQPPKWKQVDHLYEDFKKFKCSWTRVFEGPMAHISSKVKVNMLLLWCRLDGEDIYEGFNLKGDEEYNLDLIWTL